MSKEWLWGLILFARAVLFGAALGLYYEFFRILRLLFAHPAWLVALEDLLFFLPASIAHLFFHYACAGGETRWFGLVGVVLGYLLYLASAGKVLQGLAKRLKALIIKRIAEPLKKRWNDHHQKRKDKRAQRRRLREEKKTDNGA